MSRLTLLAAVAVFATACSGVVTAPDAAARRPGGSALTTTSSSCSDPTTYCDYSYPPPPPSDTSMTISDGSSTAFGALQVQYFFDPTANNGWVHFAGNAGTAGIISPDASLSFHRGVTSGRGTIQLFVDGGTLAFDLARVSGKTATWRGDCSAGCASFQVAGTLTPKVGKVETLTATLTIGAAPLTAGR